MADDVEEGPERTGGLPRDDHGRRRDVEGLERPRLRYLDTEPGEDRTPPEQDVDLGLETGRVEIRRGGLVEGGLGPLIGARGDQLQAAAGDVEGRGGPPARAGPAVRPP